MNQLSGGSKAHWLARSFSEAFLMRSTDGHAVEGAAQTQIVQRLLGVLDQPSQPSPRWTMLRLPQRLRRRQLRIASTSFTTWNCAPW